MHMNGQWPTCETITGSQLHVSHSAETNFSDPTPRLEPSWLIDSRIYDARAIGQADDTHTQPIGLLDESRHEGGHLGVQPRMGSWLILDRIWMRF